MSRSCLPALALYLLASVARANDDAAQELYKKISDAFMAAKTVHLVDAKTSAKRGSTMEFELTTSVWLATENRMSVRARFAAQEINQDVAAITDGMRIALIEGGEVRKSGEADPNVSVLFRGVLLAGGITPAMSFLQEPEMFKDGGVSDFKPLAEGKAGDRAATVIEYTYLFNTQGDDVSLAVKLYVDKDTHALLRREMSEPKEGLEISEEYGTLQFNAEPPADAFQVPDGKGGEPRPDPPADEQPK